MSDPTVPELKDRKKFMFYDSEDRQVRLKIRCAHDGLTQSHFFRMMITGYIEADEMILDYIEKCKQTYQLQGQNKIKKINQTRKKSEKNKKMFDLEKKEIENIFDMIETETNL
tara:strand:+ start:1459 stop:1797 length:339 start_codon:yes stop_codon:yes gene_type:complete